MLDSLNLEKHLIAGLLKYPDVWADIALFVSAEDFVSGINRTIFNVIKNTLNAKEPLDSVIVAQKVKELNISFENSIDIFDYLESLKVRQLSEKSVIKTASELRILTVRRSFFQVGREIQKEMSSPECSERKLSEIVSIPQKLLNKHVNLYELDNEPVDLFDGIEEIIEELGNNPVEEVGLRPPYERFRQMFGGFTPGDLYIFASPKKNGKSTLLMDIMRKVCNECNSGVKGLFLDTELETERVQFRMASALAGVNEWYLKTGNWRKNAHMVKALREKAFPLIRQFRNSIDHLYVGGMPSDEVCSLIRRWHAKNINVDKGERAIIAYDYIKLTGEKLSDSWKEYQVIGEKTDMLKQIATEIQAPLIAACQTNEEGRVAISARMAWFCSFIAFWFRKSLDELAEEGPENGTHKLVPYETRNQGEFGGGHLNVVKTTDRKGAIKYLPNHINFNVDNFNVEELSTLGELMKGPQPALDDADDSAKL